MSFKHITSGKASKKRRILLSITTLNLKIQFLQDMDKNTMDNSQ